MNASKNIILHLPMDEPKGSDVAYDYSPTRADMNVRGATFVQGINGNAIRFDGNGRAEVSKPILSTLDTPFTLMLYAQLLPIETGSPNQFLWLLNFGGVNNFIEIPIDATTDRWYHLAISHTQDDKYVFYVDGVEVHQTTHNGVLKGISLSQNYYGTDFGHAMMDDVRMYAVALTQGEIESIKRGETNQRYTIDGIDLKDFGVFVSQSDGILTRPKQKPTANVSWGDYHGVDVDLDNIYYDQREITLSCFIKADNKASFMHQLFEFEQLFDKKGLRRLMIEAHPTKPLVYEVYCKDEISISKQWSDNTMVGTFKLKLMEPQPVKRVLKHIRSSEDTKTCTINLTTYKYLNIYWGDGTATEDIVGGDIDISHDYKEDGEYYPAITGCIDEIDDFTTNAIIVWNKL